MQIWLPAAGAIIIVAYISTLQPAFAQEDPGLVWSDKLDLIVAAALGSGGIGTFIWSIWEGRRNRMLHRQQILFDLVKEFDDDDHKLKIAKDILDDFLIHPRQGWQRSDGAHYYHFDHLQEILRHHRHDKDISDEGEREIRRSFDALLMFLGKLGYLLRLGLIREDEIEYFKFHIDMAEQTEPVMRFVRMYKYGMFLSLLETLKTLKEKERRKISNRLKRLGAI